MFKLVGIFTRPEEGRQVNGLKKAINIAIVALALLSLLLLAFNNIGYTMRWEVLFEYRGRFQAGFVMTVVIAFFSLLFSLLIGILLALASRSRFLPFYYFSRVYTGIIRSTPLLVQILVFYYIIGNAVHLDNRYVLGVAILSIFSGAYIGEIIRGGVNGIDRNQHEIMRSLGFNLFQRYRLIIIPQVTRTIMPPLAGQLASLIKDSSLLSVIAVNELTRNVQEVDALTFAVFENYLLLTVLYMVLTVPILYLSQKLEKKLNYEY